MSQQRPPSGIALGEETATSTPKTIGSSQAAACRHRSELRPLLVSAQQAVSLLSIGRTTLYQLIGNGDLVQIRIGRCVRFAVHELERFVDDQRVIR